LFPSTRKDVNGVFYLVSEEVSTPSWLFWPAFLILVLLLSSPFIITGYLAIKESQCCKKEVTESEDEFLESVILITAEKEHPQSCKNCCKGKCRWFATCCGLCCKNSVKKFEETK
jgi:hypothetical protein